MSHPTSKAGAPAAETHEPTPAPAPRRNVDAMTAAPQQRPDRVRRKDIHDKWSKITDAEATAMQGKPDLVALLRARYGLSPEQAQLDVDAWAKQSVF